MGFDGQCDWGRAELNLNAISTDAEYSQAGSFENNVAKTICHENGHSMGPSHYKVGSVGGPYWDPPAGQHDYMISGHVNNDGTWRVYSSHNKSRINSNF